MSAIVQRHLLGRYTRALATAEGGAAGAAACAGVRVLMRDEGARADAPRYIELPLAETLRQALRGCVVIEFPTLTVLLADELGQTAREGGLPRWPLRTHPAAAHLECAAGP
jgi:hypothetical protein